MNGSVSGSARQPLNHSRAASMWKTSRVGGLMGSSQETNGKQVLSLLKDAEEVQQSAGGVLKNSGADRQILPEAKSEGPPSPSCSSSACPPPQASLRVLGPGGPHR
ncbi:unnamed protein product [Arctogadus glacialis]